MLEQGVWVVSLVLFVLAILLGFTSLFCENDEAEEAYWIDKACIAGVGACIFAMIGMWFY